MAACYIYIEEESFVIHRSYDTIDINNLPWHNLLPCTSISYIQRLKEPKSSTMLAFAYIFWAPVCHYWHVDSLAPGKFEWNFRHVIFKQILVIDGWGISCEIALIWMPLGFTDDQSTLVQVMAWCRQATSHYLNQCWSRSPTPHGVTRPQWVKHNWWKLRCVFVCLAFYLVNGLVCAVLSPVSINICLIAVSWPVFLCHITRKRVDLGI